jgi:hypothetical protein
MSNDRYNTRNNRKISMMSPVGISSPMGNENRYNDFNDRAFNSPMPVLNRFIIFYYYFMIFIISKMNQDSQWESLIGPKSE